MTRIAVDLDFLEANQLISAAEQHAAVLASHLERVPGVDAVLLLAAIAHTQGAVERIRAAFGITDGPIHGPHCDADLRRNGCVCTDASERVEHVRVTDPDLYAWAERLAPGRFA
jgi:hypothetical protein